MTLHAIISDIHYGVRNDIPVLRQATNDFFDNFFFPKIRERGIESVINLGDTFDRQRQTSTKTLQLAQKHFLEPLERDFQSLHLIGNHDCPFRNTNHPNAMGLFTQKWGGNLRVVSEPQDVRHCGDDFAILPWINRENASIADKVIAKSSCPIALGHLEIAGFPMLRGIDCVEGLQPSEFSRFLRVLSGHFHWRSSSGNINYVGNPHGTTLADLGNKKGFHILDGQTGDLEFVENPVDIFIDIEYDDETEEIEESLVGKFVSVREKEDVDQTRFERWIKNLKDANPYSLSVRRASVLREEVKKKKASIRTLDQEISDFAKRSSNLNDEKTKKMVDLLLELYNEAESA